MLDLYHSEPHGASARVLICLEEKGIAFTAHYVDRPALEQYGPPPRPLEPSGEIPALVREGAAYTGASAICEYLDEAFPERPLMPSDAPGRWQVRVWQKHVDDRFAPSVSEIAWQTYGARGVSSGALAQALERLVPEERPALRAALAARDEDQLARARDRVDAVVELIEAALAESAWLAGSTFSLADVAVFAFFKYLPTLHANRVNDCAAPRAMRWLRAISERPAVRAALARGRCADPFAAASPPAEQIRWG